MKSHLVNGNLSPRSSDKECMNNMYGWRVHEQQRNKLSNYVSSCLKIAIQNRSAELQLPITPHRIEKESQANDWY